MKYVTGSYMEGGSDEKRAISKYFIVFFNFIVTNQYIQVVIYCTISFNSSPHVMHDTSDEILVLTTSQTCHDTSRFSANFWQFSTTGNEFYLYLAHDHQMNLSPYKIFHDYHDISAFWRAP